jgi:hypothetical protein
MHSYVHYIDGRDSGPILKVLSAPQKKKIESMAKTIIYKTLKKHSAHQIHLLNKLYGRIY